MAQRSTSTSLSKIRDAKGEPSGGNPDQKLTARPFHYPGTIMGQDSRFTIYNPI